MLKQFRNRYPQGSLISELLSVHQGQYIVRVRVEIEGVILATALAADEQIENAEEKARQKVLTLLDLEPTVSEISLPIETFKEISPPSIFEKAAANNLPNSVVSKNSPNNILTSAEVTREEKLTPPTEVTPKEKLTPPTEVIPKEKLTPPIEVIPEEKLTPPTPPAEVISEEKLTPPTPPAEVIPEEKLTPPTPPAEVIPEEKLTPPTPLAEVIPEEKLTPPPAEIPSSPKSAITMDFSEMMIQTDVEMNRLGWTKQEGREYLVKTYGKKTRQLLSDEELKEFLEYLQSC